MPSEPLAFARRDDHRVLGGVAGGFADQHGVDPLVVRGALVMLTLAGGLGLAVYALGGAVSRSPGTDLPRPHPREARRTAAVVSITGGVLLLVRATGVWLGDSVMVSVIVLAAGVALLGRVVPGSGDRSAQPSGWAELASGPRTRTRLLAGAALVAMGLVLVGAQRGVSSNVRSSAFATALTVLGVAVVLGPWLTRLAREAAEDRRHQIRLHEREAMAAHLHDSVLQTLALIQRTADDPRRTVTLARQQERDLREWLYGARGHATGTLASSLRSMANDVETTYDVAIDLVVVGDAALVEAGSALVAAAREACVNVAKHSGVTAAAVYVEVGADAMDCWVRDRGCGFDPADGDHGGTERRGIADSMVARLERVGGSVDIVSSPGTGTEVHLSVPVAAAVAGASR